MQGSSRAPAGLRGPPRPSAFDPGSHSSSAAMPRVIGRTRPCLEGEKPREPTQAGSAAIPAVADGSQAPMSSRLRSGRLAVKGPQADARFPACRCLVFLFRSD